MAARLLTAACCCLLVCQCGTASSATAGPPPTPVRLFTEAYRPELHPTFARRMSQPPLAHQMPEIPVWGAGRSPGSSMTAFNDTKAAVALDHWATIGGGLWFGSEDTICTESFPQRKFTRNLPFVEIWYC